MTITETEAAHDSTRMENGTADTRPDSPSGERQVAPGPMSYKQAKYLAASDRRDGMDAYAVFKPSSSEWYVKHIN